MVNLEQINYLQKINKHLKSLQTDVDLFQRLLEDYSFDLNKLASYEYSLMAFERLLEKIANNIIDISFMVVKYYNLGAPKFYRQGIEILCKKKILSPNVCKLLQGIVGMRNILVHEYTDFSLDKINVNFKEQLKIFNEFIKQIENYIFVK